MYIYIYILYIYIYICVIDIVRYPKLGFAHNQAARSGQMVVVSLEIASHDAIRNR